MGRNESQSAEALWRDRLARFQESNLTISEFCRQEGVSGPSFYKWRKRLQDSDRTKVRRRRRKASHQIVGFEPFVPVNVASGMQAELEFPNGVRIRVPATDAQALRVVIQTGYEVGREGSVDA